MHSSGNPIQCANSQQKLLAASGKPPLIRRQNSNLVSFPDRDLVTGYLETPSQPPHGRLLHLPFILSARLRQDRAQLRRQEPFKAGALGELWSRPAVGHQTGVMDLRDQLRQARERGDLNLSQYLQELNKLHAERSRSRSRSPSRFARFAGHNAAADATISGCLSPCTCL